MIKWVIDNAARIFTLIEAVVNGAAQILAGNVSGVANLVERALGLLIIPVIVQLERLGLIRRTPRQARSIELLVPDDELPKLQPIKTCTSASREPLTG